MSSESIENPPIADATVPKLPQAGRHVRLISFYAGVPLVIGTYGALNNWELLERTGYLLTLGFYAAHAFIPFWITCASTSLAMWALKSVKPPPYVLMAIGALAGGLIALPYTNWLTGISGEAWQDATMARQMAKIFSPEFWRYILRAAIIWFGINFIFDRFLGLPRYRYVVPRGYEGQERTVADAAPDDAGSRRQPLPGFAERIPTKLKVEDILGIKAEQHYIRVFTPEREYMVLYRFSDAVRELDPALGMQVHRSYWVSKAAIELVRPSAKKFSLKLASGASIPVSTPYHGVVKEFARINQIPIR